MLLWFGLGLPKFGSEPTFERERAELNAALAFGSSPGSASGIGVQVGVRLVSQFCQRVRMCPNLFECSSKLPTVSKKFYGEHGEIQANLTHQAHKHW